MNCARASNTHARQRTRSHLRNSLPPTHLYRTHHLKPSADPSSPSLPLPLPPSPPPSHASSTTRSSPGPRLRPRCARALARTPSIAALGMRSGLCWACGCWWGWGWGCATCLCSCGRGGLGWILGGWSYGGVLCKGMGEGWEEEGRGLTGISSARLEARNRRGKRRCGGGGATCRIA